MKNRYGLVLMLLFLMACLSTAPQVHAKEDIDPSKLPSLLASSNAGTDFWFLFPVCFPEQGGQNSLKIYVSAGSAVQCTVEVPGMGVRYVKTTKPNDIIEFTMYPGEGQPYESNGMPDIAKTEDQTYAEGKGRGIHVTAPVPIVVYGVSRYVYTSDSFLAIPTSALGKEYIISSFADLTGGAFAGLHLPSQTIVIAPYDNTVVTFTLGGSQGTQTVGGMRIGQSKNFRLNKGDIVAFASKKANGIFVDLSGSKFTATKPIAVVSGNQCAYVPETVAACDFIMEMELPTNTWGKEYHISRFVKRKKYAMMKIFAKEPNTKLYRDGNPIPFAVLSTAGGRQGSGYYEGRVLDDGLDPRPIVIKGDKPISITTYNPGQTDDGVSSDPFQLILTPIEQYQKEIIFNTPGIKGGQGFKENYVNLVFEGNADGTMPDDLEFATVNDGKFVWKSVRSVFGATSEPFKGFPGDTKKYYAKIITLPGDGVYKIRAQKPFAAYAYGFDSFDSYGHPTSVALGDLSVRDPDAPDFSFTQQCDGSVNDGKVEDLPKAENDTIKRSNLRAVSLLDGSKNYLLEVEEFVPGDARTTNWKLRVEDASQDALAHVYFVDRAGNDTTVTISYAAPAVRLAETSLNWGLLKVNQEKTMQLVVRNTSTTMPQRITKMEIRGKARFRWVSEPELPQTLEPGESRSFDIIFSSPTEDENVRDSVMIEINDCNKIGAELLAKVGEPVINVSNADFAINPTGVVVERTIIVKNTGKVQLTVTGYTLPTVPQFTLTGWPAITEANPMILQPQQEQQLIISFTSDVAAKYADYINFISDTRKTGPDVDSVALLTAQTVAGNLVPSDYDWKRRRINRTYGGGTVTVVNTGDQEVRIISGKKRTDKGINPEAFEIAPIANVTVQPGDTLRLNATFNPTATGDHHAYYQIVTDKEDVEAMLMGIGTTALLATEDMNFGSTLVNSATPRQKQIRIINQKLDNKIADSTIGEPVVISDLTVTPAGTISTVMTGFGTEGFRFNKAGLNLPVTLAQGDTLYINAEFVAPRGGAAEASVTPVSDADNTVTSRWTGAGLTEGIAVNFESAPVCIDADGELVVTIRNDNNTDAIIESITVTNPSNGATFTATTPTAFTVAANGGTATVRYRVNSSVVGMNTATLMIESSVSADAQPLNVSFESRDYTRTASMSRGLKVDVGDKIEAGITIDNGDNFALAGISRLDVSFNYNPTLVQLDESSIATDLRDFVITRKDINRTLGTVSFSVESVVNATLPSTGALNIAKWKFDAFLNGQPIDSMEIRHTVTAYNNRCLKIESRSGFLTVNPVCGGDVRRINISGITYALQSVSPNPVPGGSMATVQFSVGLKGHTVIEVYNAMGTPVGHLVNQELEPGTYEVPMNTESLSSGVYYYRIISGPFTEAKEIVVAK
ncbi:MAG TPA: choice-of-anchor D domain-containing protein [Patescibacteria group bacterium]|nr:choice-of-anchor D domain-containing protein [Patescibacteria group bacterium]